MPSLHFDSIASVNKQLSQQTQIFVLQSHVRFFPQHPLTSSLLLLLLLLHLLSDLTRVFKKFNLRTSCDPSGRGHPSAQARRSGVRRLFAFMAFPFMVQQRGQHRLVVALQTAELRCHICPEFISSPPPPLVVSTGPQLRRRLRQQTVILVQPGRTSLWVRLIRRISTLLFFQLAGAHKSRLLRWLLIIFIVATSVIVINLIDCFHRTVNSSTPGFCKATKQDHYIFFNFFIPAKALHNSWLPAADLTGSDGAPELFGGDSCSSF